MLLDWRTLETELVDILRRHDAPLSNQYGETWLVDFDLDGNEYLKICISDVAKELADRGIVCKTH